MTHRILKTTTLALGMALASFAVAFAEPDPKPKPDDPKPKADIAMTAAQGQAETASTRSGQFAGNGLGASVNARTANATALQGADAKAAQKNAALKKKAAPAEILPYIEHK